VLAQNLNRAVVNSDRCEAGVCIPRGIIASQIELRSKISFSYRNKQNVSPLRQTSKTKLAGVSFCRRRSFSLTTGAA